MPVITTQFPASISVTNLNGLNGFAITAVPGQIELGSSVKGAGDVNGDGIEDLIIGAPHASGGGASYVLFGQSGIGVSGSVGVSSLTGSNGFTITGFPAGGQGGFSVSGAGDVNGDGIADLIIGALFSNSAGAGYVLFGQSGIGSSGSVSVSSLTGSNGFTISGFTGYPDSSEGGFSVSGIGDVNGDGIADLIIGAPETSSSTGMSYVLFGQVGIGSSGTVSISSLTGSNGFVITGFPATSNGGWSVSGAGDVNADGVADLVIGAPTAFSSVGISYVIFGKSGIGSSGSVSVSGLTGVNGFAITGFLGYPPTNSDGGYSVSGAGDVNGDGVADLVIGAPLVFQNGVNYVLFGQSGMGSSGSLNVTSLTSSNGFTITGGGGGWSVSGAGDVNGDGISDIIIGAPSAFSTAGAAYVIFGKSGIGSSGSVSVSSLTGSNGFVITGFPSGSQGGASVSGAGDVNGDGVADIIIGAPAPGVPTYAGRGYVIFGEPTSLVLSKNQLTIKENQTLGWSSQYLNATNPKNPTNDLSLQFILTSIQHGRFFASSNPSVSLTAFTQQQVRSGQIQFSHDGSQWAPSYDVSLNYQGMFAMTSSQAAVITFKQSFVLVKNNLTINQGETVFVTSSDLSANDLYNSANNPNLVFSVSNVQHGYFELNSAPATSFTQAQVQGGVVQFVPDGSLTPPSYSISVINGMASIAPQTVTVSFDGIPIFINNNLTINQGQTVVLSSSNLSATNPYNSGASLTFSVSNVVHGYFALTSAPAISITSFTQSQVQSGVVQFVHDGSSNTPSYLLSVSDGRASSSQSATISFDAIPIFSANSLTINQGQTVVLGLTDLNASDAYAVSFFTYTVSNVKYGYFAFTNALTTPITSFTQLEIQSGSVQFVHDGSINPPSYNVSVTDGRMTSSAQAATISFDVTPTLITNTLTINQGQTVVLTSINLSASDPYTSSFTFYVSNAVHGYFAFTNALTTAITSFTQLEIQSGSVQFVHDGSVNPPSYSIRVSDGRMTTSFQTATISFDSIPTLINNSLTINQGETVVLSSNNLSATNPYNSGANLAFTVSNISHGYFAFTSNPSASIISFTQAQIQNNEVQFVQDGSVNTPSYSIEVSDGRTTSVSQLATISFNTTPVLTVNSLTLTQGQTVILTSNNLNANDPDGDSFTFVVSNVQHGYFALVSDSGNVITSFTSAQIQSGQIEFISDGSSTAPSFSVSVNDGHVVTNPQRATIAFTPNGLETSGSSNDNTVRNAIIGGTVSGGVGLLFLFLKLYLTRRATLSLQNAMEGGEGYVEKQQAAYYKEVIRPIINSVFEKISTTGFLGYRSEKDVKAYIVAIEKIITRLSRVGVNTNLMKISPPERSALINEIAKQTRKVVIKEHGFCSTATLCRFFKPEATPEQIEDKAQDIAAAVKKEIEEGHIPPSIAAPVLSSPVSQNRESLLPSAAEFQKFVDIKEVPASVTPVNNPNFFVSVVTTHQPQQLQPPQIELEVVQPGLTQIPAG